MGLILDTNFVITAEREARRGTPGRADAFLAQRPSENFFITFTVAGELACGQSASARHDWERLCRPYPVLPWTMEIAWHYGEPSPPEADSLAPTTSGSPPPHSRTGTAS